MSAMFWIISSCEEVRWLAFRIIAMTVRIPAGCISVSYTHLIQEIIESQAGREGLTDDEVHKKLQDLWGGTEYGRKLLEMFIALE